MAQDRESRMAYVNEQIKERMLRRLAVTGKVETDIDGLFLMRQDESHKVQCAVSQPLVGIIIQGSKCTMVGSESFTYGANQGLLVGVDMPSTFYVCDAMPERPFLSLSLHLDSSLITRLAVEMPQASGASCSRGTAIADMEPEVLDAFLRLLDLLDKPHERAVLSPMILREIHYRLLTGPMGAHLRKLNTQGTQSNQIAQAITWLRNNFTKPLQVEQLARRVNMATSTFHRHFKEVTTLSPLQFHKQLRLYEAQRLMLAENADAASASMAVGYESSTQFNREYKRLFGQPPLRDIRRLLKADA